MLFNFALELECENYQLLEFFLTTIAIGSPCSHLIPFRMPATLILKLIFLHLSSSKSEHLRLKLECEKLAQEKTEMQRHYVMVSFLINLSRSRFQIKRGQLNIRDLNPYVQLYF